MHTIWIATTLLFLSPLTATEENTSFPYIEQTHELKAPEEPAPEKTKEQSHEEVSFLEKHLSSKSDNTSYEHAFLKMILTLAGLIFLIFFTLWALRRLSSGRIGGFSSQKKIKILEKRPLSPKTAIYLLELDGRQVFIAESQLEVKTLFDPHETELD